MKNRFTFAAWALYLGLLASMLWVPVANAYIDPGSGSIIFQVVVGAALAISVGLKVFWRRIVGFFSRKDVDVRDEGGRP